MREIFVITKRSMKLYLKNPLSILFSFVYMLLFIVLISMFLGDYMAKGMMDIYAGVEGVNFGGIRWLVDSTAMAGVLMINCMLVPLNVLTVMVQDSDSNRLDSFMVSAISRGKLVLGYWLAPFLTGTLLNTLCLFISQMFVVINGGDWLLVRDTMQMIGLIIINVFSATSIFFVVALLVKKSSLYSTVTGIVSALVGFITGAFLPIGVFPAGIQKVFAFIPAHHGATMMRQVMTQKPLLATFGHVIDQTVKNTYMTAEEIVNIYTAENGIIYLFDGVKVSFSVMVAVVIGSGILFMVVSVLIMKRYKRT